MRMIIATVGWILVATAGRLAAQNDEREVLAAVQQLFDGMRAQDTARMRAVLHPDARLLSAGVREGIPVVTVVSPGRWLEGVAKATGGTLDERLRNPVVQVDGGLASVWVEYTFYVGERMSHCGVDAFHLARTPEGWRIVDLADTRRREGCQP
ncbi:MAG TPA: nuclear transport factor 2 family protein [Gemmatimonadales bacterium]|nr:nuclear transport factor 2 family protein [Gemmatimonadales bacterium]